MKKMKVRSFLILEALVSLLLPVFYFLSFSVRGGDGVMTVRVSFNVWLFFALVLAAAAALAVLRRRSERYDEYARRAVEMADAICFKAAMAFLCCVLLPLLLVTTVLREPPITSGDVLPVGAAVVCGVCALLLLRAVIFCVIDKRGMER